MDFLEGILYMIWRGIAIGVIISAPMGPVGILCVQRTLDKGRKNGLFTGVGAAISDLFYCLLTGFGLSFIEDFLKANQDVIQIVGSVVLVVFGIYLFKSNPARTLKKPEDIRVSKRKTILSGFLFTVSNPLIIFLIIGLFARFNFLLPEISLFHYIVGFVGIIAGALLWWWVVTYFVDKVRSHFNLRSMWLINKITGCIIMIFALVGIITAVVNIADASTIYPKFKDEFYNSQRGFSGFENKILHQGELHHSDNQEFSPGEPLKLQNFKSDSLVLLLPLDSMEDFSFSFRLANRHASSAKKYVYFLDDGTRLQTRNPSWGILLLNKDGGKLFFKISSISDKFDYLNDGELQVALFNGKECLQSASIKKGIDVGDGYNSFRLRRIGSRFILSGGNREYSPIIDCSFDIYPDYIGFVAAPASQLELDCISLLYPESLAFAEEDNEFSRFAIDDVRDSYFIRSTDELEGEYELFDMNADNDMLLSGGSYRVALFCDENNGYRLLYLSGAKINPSGWHPGKLKANFLRTSFRNIFDVEWLNPEGVPLRGPIKAQFDSDSHIITIRFATHDSEIRLRKVKRQY